MFAYLLILFFGFLSLVVVHIRYQILYLKGYKGILGDEFGMHWSVWVFFVASNGSLIANALLVYQVVKRYPAHLPGALDVANVGLTTLLVGVVFLIPALLAKPKWERESEEQTDKEKD